ncbi:hypothetical protein BD414DRAFT_488902 [Trametes punicea]|nr:hypothetical protein BD414DRAFT_488902 [Trametes punicea]
MSTAYSLKPPRAVDKLALQQRYPLHLRAGRPASSLCSVMVPVPSKRPLGGQISSVIAEPSLSSVAWLSGFLSSGPHRPVGFSAGHLDSVLSRRNARAYVQYLSSGDGRSRLMRCSDVKRC